MFIAFSIAIVIFFVLRSQSRTEVVSKKAGEGVAKVVTTSVVVKDAAVQESKNVGTSAKAGTNAFMEAYKASRKAS